MRETEWFNISKKLIYFCLILNMKRLLFKEFNNKYITIQFIYISVNCIKCKIYIYIFSLVLTSELNIVPSKLRLIPTYIKGNASKSFTQFLFT